MPVADTFGYKEKVRSISVVDDWYEKPPQVWARELERQLQAASLQAYRRRAALRRAALAYIRRKEEEKRLVQAQALEVEFNERFRRLADQWRKETQYISSLTQMAMHPAYQKIIGMGQQAVPLILREMQQHGGHWLWALHVITDEDPVQPNATFREAVQAWLEWGKQRGYLA